MYVIRVATPEARDLVVDALRKAADQRTRVARGAAGQVAAEKRAGKDPRPAAVRAIMILADADELVRIADELAKHDGIKRYGPDDVVDPTPTIEELKAQLTGVADDGTSPEAQALAELAGLVSTDPDAVEDAVTGALPEDSAGTDAKVEL